MQKKKARRANFRINHCSSEDPQYPVTQLLLQSPDAKGWQCKRFATYPQIIIIELVEPTLLRQISFLSHQSKIATKIEIEIKLDESKDWKKLGYVSLTSNQNTNYQARELRSANLNGPPACFIKFTFRQNHVNNLNIFNQVGLISLCVYGDKMTEGNYMPTQQMAQMGQMGQEQRQPSSSLNNLEFDKQTLAKIRQLEAKKKQAVDNEQFDVAKRIKQQIERIKSIGQTLILLQQKKQQAIKREDYENAQIINQKMKQMRDQHGFGANTLTKGPVNPPPVSYANQRASYQEQQLQDSVSPVSKQTKVAQERMQMTKKEPQIKNPSLVQKPVQKGQKQMDERPLNNGGFKPPANDDERPLDIKGGNKMQNEYAEEQQQRGGGEVQPLSKEILGQCQPYFEFIDQDIFCLLYSKDHKNRENGVKMIKDKLNGKVSDREGMIEATLFAIKCVIDDRIASVLISVLELFDTFMKKMKPGANPNNLPYAEYILQRIADYLGHTNQKIVNISETIYSNLPIYQLTNKDVCFKCLSMTYKREKPPKILGGKLKMICKLVTEFQLGRNYEDLLSYVVKYVDDKNNDVRTPAINAVVAIAKQIGYQAVQPFLKNVRPQIIKSIEDQMEEGDGDDRNYEDKPIKPKGAQNVQSKNPSKKTEIQSVQNEFIQVPKHNNNNNEQDDRNCPFCKKFDERFAQQDYLDMHYFHSCPMLTICLECKQTIEISTLTSHLVGQCPESKFYKKCPRCKEAVLQKNYKTHVEKKECLSAKPLAAANRCPLCHLDIGPGANGWKQHLVDQGCENNPRQ